MAIRMMTTAEEYARLLRESGPADLEVVHDYPGHESDRVSHDLDCPHRDDRDAIFEMQPQCAALRCRRFGPLYMRTTHRGLVLRDDGERNGYDDSDFYAVVWNPEKGAPEEVEFGTTRGWSYPNNAVADATAETLAAYEAWQDKRRAEREKALFIERAHRVTVGGEVRVLRNVNGRKPETKVRAGEVGRVFWARDGRLGVRNAERTFWINQDAVEGLPVCPDCGFDGKGE